MTEHRSESTAESAAQSTTVLRHSKTVRAIHWAVALSGLTLLFSGFGELPMYKRYMLTDIPGMAWAGDFEIQLVIHYLAAIVFSAASLFHVVYHWRRREFEAVPRRGDVKESVEIMKAMVRGTPEPPQRKFLAEQRLAYAAIGGTTAVLILTGFLKSLKNFDTIAFGHTTQTVITLVHTASAMVFLLLFFAHMAAFLVKPNRPLFKTMFTGRVKLSYARHRHEKWDVEPEEA